MTPHLNETLATYFAAQNAHEIDGPVACFADDAVVHDEGEDIAGIDAIRAWKQATSAKYQVTAEPIESEPEGEHTIVVARVSGNFPGSPANLTYRFGFNDRQLIQSLKID